MIVLSFFGSAMLFSTSGVGNHALITSQKHAQQGLQGRTNFPPTFPFPFPFMMSIKLGIYEI